MDRKQIAAVLEEMGTLLELQGANPFKSRAFHNAARAMEGVVGDLGGMIGSGDLLKVPGIGKSIAAIIGDLVTKGSSEEYTALKSAFPSGVLEMLRIQGLGPKRVRVLFEKLKISNVDTLETAAREERLASLEGFGKKTEENILKGIEALRRRGEKSLYPVAAGAAETLLAALKRRREVIRGEIAGSIRRRKEVVGDIDIVLSARNEHWKRLMKHFVSHPLVEQVAVQGDTKSSVVLAGGIRADLRIVRDAEFPFALNYFTGSKEHNVELRTRARKYRLSLNEYGFSPIEGGRRAPRCKDETALYAALDLAYIPPELRENKGEIAAAEQGTLPRLVEWEDIRGTFHCHTTYSDGVHSLKEMAGAAQALGWEYLGIGDHSRSAAYAGGLTPDRVRDQLRAIDTLNAESDGFRVFKGTECDILADGTLDWPEKILASFEYVVVSVHSNFRMSERDMTRRIVRALKNRHVTMLGHPTGRLLLARDPYPVDMTQVIDAAAGEGTIIEINAHPMRLDLDWRLCEYARRKGVMIAINPDAHAMEGLQDVRLGVGIARKGWLEARHVLNTRPAAEIARALRISS